MDHRMMVLGKAMNNTDFIGDLKLCLHRDQNGINTENLHGDFPLCIPLFCGWRFKTMLSDGMICHRHYEVLSCWGWNLQENREHVGDQMFLCRLLGMYGISKMMNFITCSERNGVWYSVIILWEYMYDTVYLIEHAVDVLD